MTVSLGSSGPGAEAREDQAAGLSSEPLKAGALLV